MKATKAKYLELFQHKTESDGWDYKKELHIKTKNDKYNIIKDFLAFSNFGGGYILIGIDEDSNFEIVNVKKKIDASSLGDVIEFNLGFNIRFDINYFDIEDNQELITVGIIYIYPSSNILTCPKILQGNKNKVIVGVNDILTRRNTKSTKANSEDIAKITYRLFSKTHNQEINDDKLPIFKDNHQEVSNLWGALNNNYILNSENISIILRSILWFSKHGKIDFANLVGIEIGRFKSLLKGYILPSLDEIVRISNLVELDINFFFQTNVRGAKPFWKSDLVRYSILKLIKPVSSISRIKDVEKFLGSIVYETAKNIYYLHSMIHGKEILQNSEWMFNKKIIKSYKSILDSKKTDFFGELSHQHYKLLEQVTERETSRGFTKPEEIVLLWHFSNSEYLARIFTEAIKGIKIIDKEKYDITFHFWDELITKKIRGRTYDAKNIKMTFSKIRLELQTTTANKVYKQ